MRKSINDKKCEWEIIKDFQSLSEFDRFVEWISSQIESHEAVEEDVKTPYAGASMKERWFRHIKSQSLWRLVYPDVPFKGVFEPVPVNE